MAITGDRQNRATAQGTPDRPAGAPPSNRVTTYAIPPRTPRLEKQRSSWGAFLFVWAIFLLTPAASRRRRAASRRAAVPSRRAEQPSRGGHNKVARTNKPLAHELRRKMQTAGRGRGRGNRRGRDDDRHFAATRRLRSPLRDDKMIVASRRRGGDGHGGRRFAATRRSLSSLHDDDRMVGHSWS